MGFEDYLPGDFITFAGPFRNGKTSGAVRLAYKLWKRGHTVVSNIPLVFSSQLITTVEQVFDMRGCVFLWDEIQATLDSRSFAGPVQIELTKQSIYFGKRGNILIMTTPAMMLVDIRYRTYTHHLYKVRKIKQYGKFYAVNEYCSYDCVGPMEVEIPRGKFRQPLAKYGPLFDTFYEEVILTSGEQGKPGAQAQRAPGASSKKPVISSSLY